MIIHLRSSLTEQAAHAIARDLQAVAFRSDGRFVLVTSSSVKSLDARYDDAVDEGFVCDSDIQLASRNYIPSLRKVAIGSTEVGGATRNTLLIAGPCSVESEAQITDAAELVHRLGISALRAGCFKPRTSPYSFQGMGREGLRLLDKMRSRYGLTIVTEVRDATHVEEVIDHADVVQVGAKAMYDHGILRHCGKAHKPVLLKRGFGATLQEFVQAAEFVLSGGNHRVLLCERGIRTFETKTRFTLDLCGVAYLKEHTNLPVVLDPSHAMGEAYGVADLAKASVAMGVSGLMIEVHRDPSAALSDASQQLTHPQFETLVGGLREIARAAGYALI